MAKRVLILDTSVLCCWLRVPGKETAGPPEDLWTHERIRDLLEQESAKGSTFVLPLATLIETGNHVAQSMGNRYALATSLGQHIENAADANTPWAAFTDQSTLWERARLIELAQTWPDLAAGGFSIGDATIKYVAEYYAAAGFAVEILTGDQGLKAYEPARPAAVPRRRNQPTGI